MLASAVRAASRRGYATVARSMIPPNVAAGSSASAAGGAAAAPALGAELKPIVSLYRGLPKGHATSDPSKLTEGLFVGYRNKHFQNGKETGAPLVHIILLVFGVGYTMAYNAHLSAFGLYLTLVIWNVFPRPFGTEAGRARGTSHLSGFESHTAAAILHRAPQEQGAPLTDASIPARGRPMYTHQRLVSAA